MRPYRFSVNLKLGLILFAVGLAVASLWYTNNLVDRLREREQALMQLWAKANEQVTQAPADNPYLAELETLDDLLRRWRQAPAGGDMLLPVGTADSLRRAVSWAQGMPPGDQLDFILNEIIEPNPFNIPAIVTDSTKGAPLFWRNVPIPDTVRVLSTEDSLRLVRRVERMAAAYEPIAIQLSESPAIQQYVHYDESGLIRELRIYPYVQLFFVGLFVLIGYVGFSYVRRSEQSSLWVGMAKEAAHQLGTPISSLMGWTELLRTPGLPEAQQKEALDEIENDIIRLKRITARFSDIGSQPRRELADLRPVLEEAVGYIRRRIPQQRGRVEVTITLGEGLEAPINQDLFEWVIENLLKNALDAIDHEEGAIAVTAQRLDDTVQIDVQDNGKGIERRDWSSIFRPGYSTKRHGWGLGLSLAKRIVEDYHGGELTVAQSKVGEGTTFRIELPAG